MQSAYEVYLRLVRLFGRSLTYQEILALLITAELGSIASNISLFEAALEGLARQFYERCGSGGVCTGDDLWKFLGSMQGWYNGDVINKFKNGSYRNFSSAARRILASDAWRSGAVGNRPYHYGNLEWLFGADLRGDILSGVKFGASLEDGRYWEYQLGTAGYDPGQDFAILTYNQWWALQVYTNDDYTITVLP